MLSLKALPILVVTAVWTAASPEPPEHGFVVFSSNRTGQWRIWRMNPDGSDQVQLSGNSHQAVMPTISPNGKWVAYRQGHSSDARAIWLIRPDGTEEHVAVPNADRTHYPVPPAWDRGSFYYVKGHKVCHLSPGPNRTEVIHDLAAHQAIEGKSLGFGGITHDGRWIVAWSNLYRGGYTGANGRYSSGNSAIILDIRHPSKVYFFGHGCEPSTPPSGEWIYHVGNGHAPNTNRDGPDIAHMAVRDIVKPMKERTTYRMEIGYPDKKWGHEYFPRVSNDNTWVAYSATSGEHHHFRAPYEVFLHRLGDGSRRIRLTRNRATDNWPHLWVGKQKRARRRIAHRRRDIHLKVNAGGNQVRGWAQQHRFVDSKSNDYVAAKPIDTKGVDHAAPPEVYRTCRHRNPVFHFPASQIPDGSYRVRLHMAEPHFVKCEEAKRHMAITIENEHVEQRFDPCRAADGCRRACVREYRAEVEDGNGLTIAFDGQGRDGFVMGMEIIGR